MGGLVICGEHPALRPALGAPFTSLRSCLARYSSDGLDHSPILSLGIVRNVATEKGKKLQHLI